MLSGLQVTRRAFSVIAAAAISVALTGCESNLMLGPASVAIESDELVVAICESIDATSLSVSARPDAFGSRSMILLEQRGEVRVESGSVFGIADGVVGMTTTQAQDEGLVLPSGVVVQLHSADGGDITAAFSIGPDGIPEDSWLHPDGSVSDDPCVDSIK